MFKVVALLAIALFAAVSAVASDVQDPDVPQDNSQLCGDATVQLRDGSSAQQRDGSCPYPNATYATMLPEDGEGILIGFKDRGQCAAVVDEARRAPCTLVQSTEAPELAFSSAAADTPCCSRSDVCVQTDDIFYCLPGNPEGKQCRGHSGPEGCVCQCTCAPCAPLQPFL